jgi:hypothetical protein
MIIKVRSVNRLTFNIEGPTFTFQKAILPMIGFIVSPLSVLVGRLLGWWSAGVAEYWSIGALEIFRPITPSLRYSIFFPLNFSMVFPFYFTNATSLGTQVLSLNALSGPQ